MSPTNPGAMGFDAWLSHDNFFELNPVLSRDGGRPERLEGESSEIIIQETIRFISTAKKQKKPFLAVVWFGSPHEPYSGLEKDLARYEKLPTSYQKLVVRLTSNETGHPTTRPPHEVLQERYAEITAMDRAIGQLRQWLDAEGLRQNTLLWYCGDNGSPSGASITTPFRGQKATVYEGGVRVPGIIEWPARIPKPRVSAVNAVTSDTLPTICDLLNLPRPERPLDGISLKPLIDGEMTERASPICFSLYGGSSVRLRVPVDERLEENARLWATHDSGLLRLEGARALRHFKNEKNARLLKQLLSDSSVTIVSARSIHTSSRRSQVYSAVA